MKNKSSCSQGQPAPKTSRPVALLCAMVFLCLMAYVPLAQAGGDAPLWMHSLTNAPLPAYDEKTNAVVLYSDIDVTVLSVSRVRTHVRMAYKILRPDGRHRGEVFIPFNSPAQKVTSLHGWCIPAQGKDYEVKDKDASELAIPHVEGSDLINDVRAKFLNIPASNPGSIIGYEYEIEEQPLVLQDAWTFQQNDPVRESHYSLQLPSSWEFKATWLNHAEVKPTAAGANSWQWSVNDVKEIREEREMPPFDGVAGRLIVSFFPPGGPALNGFSDWDGMGKWYSNLVSGRMEASPQMRQEVATLTGTKNTSLEKMQAMANFVQHNIRYVAIELGIGGWQPHAAPEVFSHRYGDCKDKATLMRSMLREIGVDSYHVAIYTERGAITPETPAHHGFNHVITAIKLPDGLSDPSLVAVIQHPKLGKLLFFDPTDELTPFGQIRGPLQANYGLLVTPGGGELIELPQQASSMNSISRTARLTLNADGTLKGEVKETRLGDRAAQERDRLRTVTKDTDRIKPIEELLAGSLASFRITGASVINQTKTDLPFGFNYAFESPNYGKNAGSLMLVRPRVVGNEAVGLLETKEPRQFPIEFEGPGRDTDTFEITIPPGYVVDDIPPPVDADYGFASYHSKTVVTGNVVGYTRTFEVKELSVPVNKADDLKMFYRVIATDERNTVVLKPSP